MLLYYLRKKIVVAFMALLLKPSIITAFKFYSRTSSHLQQRIFSIDDSDASDPIVDLTSANYKRLSDGSFVDSSGVDYILDEIKSLLNLKAPSGPDDNNLNVNEAVVNDQISYILGQLKSQGSDAVATELLLLRNDVKDGLFSKDKASEIRVLKALDTDTFQTSLYSSSSGPMTVVYGPGPVGQDIINRLKALGPAVKFKKIDATAILALPDSELSFALRDSKTLLIAADNIVSSKGGWFSEEPASVIYTAGLKRILNAATIERNRGNSSKMKVVLLGKAVHQKKGLASILLSGDAGNLENDAVLQCRARGFDYCIVKVGNIISDNDELPRGLRNRNVRARSCEIERPIAFTNGLVESSEVTRLSIATEALLRAATHDVRNSTITVLSSYSSEVSPSDAEWNDEFLKIQGPELAREPLIYASVERTVKRLHRLKERFSTPGCGLVTPVESSLFINGLRFLFRPVISEYKSAKEERDDNFTKKKGESISAAIVAKQRSYLSPEVEAALQNSSVGDDRAIKKSRLEKPEGGLEVIVDALPYPRVRVRRCNVGAETIVKEESEAIILKSILREIDLLENDYRIVMSSRV